MSDMQIRSGGFNQGKLQELSFKDAQAAMKLGASGDKEGMKTALEQLGFKKVQLVDKAKTEQTTEPTAKRTTGFLQKHPTVAKVLGFALLMTPLLNLAVIFNPEKFFGGPAPQPDTDLEKLKNNAQVKQGYYNDLKDQYGDKLATLALAKAGIDLTDPTKPLEQRQVELANQALESASRPKFQALYTNDRLLDAISNKVAGGSLSDSFTKEEIKEIKQTIRDAIRDAQPAMSRKGVRGFVAHTLKTRMDEKLAALEKQFPEVPTHKPGTKKEKAPTVPELVNHFASDDTLNELCMEKNGASLRGNFNPSEIIDIKEAVEEAIRDSDPTMTRDQARDFTMDLLRTRFEEKLQGLGQEQQNPAENVDTLVTLFKDEGTLDELCRETNNGIALKQLLDDDKIQELKNTLESEIRESDPPMSLEDARELAAALLLSYS